MEIVRIFADIDETASSVWTVRYAEHTEAEYDRLFDLWVNVEYLIMYFEQHKAELEAEFWRFSVDEAVNKTIEEAWDFGDMIYELAHGNKWDDFTDITQIFKPLVKQGFDARNRRKYKVKPGVQTPFLRLYAIRLEDDTFVITGGAIKLTAMMDGDEMQAELQKMEQVKYYLKENGISYLEDLTT